LLYHQSGKKISVVARGWTLTVAKTMRLWQWLNRLLSTIFWLRLPFDFIGISGERMSALWIELEISISKPVTETTRQLVTPKVKHTKKLTSNFTLVFHSLAVLFSFLAEKRYLINPTIVCIFAQFQTLMKTETTYMQIKSNPN